ncbi:MAG TPA: type II toxin-antitoxin system VapC family toxin [Candidatus Angelobacter sp.]|jgi:PIN domain nuclease of toxin-antitoxin system|nr:type II toxin-antitoxin system VapC family toxin [Candidatus Angelobacter sp.]
MNVLADTHAVLWWFTAPARLSLVAASALKNSDNRIYVSAAVAWELAIKTNSGRLNAQPLLSSFSRLLFERGFRRLAISTEHAVRAGMLPRHHSDPFDRMLIAQSQALDFAIISADEALDAYGVRRIW